MTYIEKIIYLKSDNRVHLIRLKDYLEYVINSSQNFKKILMYNLIF